MGKANSVLRIYMLAHGVHDNIPRAVLFPRPVNGFILATFCCKTGRCVCDPGNVIRVRVLVHVMVHVIDGIVAVRIAEEVAKTVRQKDCDDPLINELVDSKGLFQFFQSSAFF